jgi:hypothetical protein
MDDAERRAHELFVRRVQQTDASCLFCNARQPVWALLPLGGLLCIDCAGACRRHSVAGLMLRSLTLDTWTNVQRSHMTGNALVRRWWAAFNLPLTRSSHRVEDARLFLEWKKTRVLPESHCAEAIALLRAKGVSDDARELLLESFVSDWTVFGIVLPERVRCILRTCFLCFARYARLDKYLRTRLACSIVAGAIIRTQDS